MPPGHIVIIEKLDHTFVDIRDRLVSLDIDVVILERPPEPFNKDVINGPTSAVHADRDRGIVQNLDELRACELTALIRVKDLRRAVLQCFLETLDAEICVQCIR